jgi:endonuclease YncB( thermonuclease family)
VARIIDDDAQPPTPAPAIPLRNLPDRVPHVYGTPERYATVERIDDRDTFRVNGGPCMSYPNTVRLLASYGIDAE